MVVFKRFFVALSMALALVTSSLVFGGGSAYAGDTPVGSPDVFFGEYLTELDCRWKAFELSIEFPAQSFFCVGKRLYMRN
jgi:hypothetical protein